MAGGWDHRVAENVQYFDELDVLVDKYCIRDQVKLSILHFRYNN